MFAALELIAADAILGLMAAFRADPDPRKVDLGVGVYRDDRGETPVLEAVRQAEEALVAQQSTKTYVGPTGNPGFNAELEKLVFGATHAALSAGRIRSVQTPGGCGALRLGFELIATANPGARVLVGTPTWPNHPPIISAVRLSRVDYPYYERGQGAICFEDMLEALSRGAPGDVALLHGCCHNPTGADLNPIQWAEVADVCRERGLIPLVDIAYQGFGQGLDEDAAGLRGILSQCDEVIIAQSCDKNFSVYRDRVGCLFVKTGAASTTATAMGHVFQRAREMWSMPPDHGAAAARIILDDPELHARWLVELAAMRNRINSVRQRIASADPRLAFIGRQYGMFSMLPLSREQVLKLREDHAIYMAESGRFNVVGMGDQEIDRFIAAVVGALDA